MKCLGLPLAGSPRLVIVAAAAADDDDDDQVNENITLCTPRTKEHPFFLFLFLQLSSDGSHTIR